MRHPLPYILVLALASLLAGRSAEAGSPYSDRYEAWSAAHPFPLGSWFTGENPSPAQTTAQQLARYQNAGYTRLTSMWSPAARPTAQLAENSGYDWMLLATTGATYQQFVDDAMTYGDGPSAMNVADEPTNADIADVAARIHWVQNKYQTGVPHAQAPLVYVNLSASGFNLDSYIQQADPDVLSYDRYPLFLDGTTDRNYFSEMNQVRGKSLQYNIPMWMIQQGFSRTWSEDGQQYRLPSDSDMRFQAFSFLAHGGQGIDHFIYLTESFPEGVIAHAGNQPTQVYYAIADMSPEILNLAPALRLIRPTGAVEFLGQATSQFNNVTPFVSTAARKLRQVEGAETALFSRFLDETGGEYFMLVNLKHGAGLTKTQAQDSMTLFFDPAVTSILRLNRLTGEPERLATLDNPSGGNRYLTLALEGGTGDLFKYGNTPFAGITLGDGDLDGDVDLSDLGLLASYYGVASGARWSKGDFDLDGDVDLNDLGTLASNYNAGAAQALSDFQALNIPEPASTFWLVLMAAVIPRHPMTGHCPNASQETR